MQNDNLFSGKLHTLGFIEAVSVENNTAAYKKENSTEDFVGKITAIFSPYIQKNISDNKFVAIQGEIKKVVCEIRGQK